MRRRRRKTNSLACGLQCNPRGHTLVERARAFIARHIVHHIEDLGMEPRQAEAAAYDEARKKGYPVPRARNVLRSSRRRNAPLPTIAEDSEAVTYRGGSGKTGSYIHEFETGGVQAIPVVGGEVELPDGTVLEVEPGSVLQRSRQGHPLWMEE